MTLGRVALPNRMNFRKSSKGGGGGGGGGVIFNPKIYITDFGNFNQGFLIMKLIQKSNFRVQGMFFSTIVLRKIKTKHFEEPTSDSPTLWNFSENSSILVP